MGPCYFSQTDERQQRRQAGSIAKEAKHAKTLLCALCLLCILCDTPGSLRLLRCLIFSPDNSVLSIFKLIGTLAYWHIGTFEVVDEF